MTCVQQITYQLLLLRLVWNADSLKPQWWCARIHHFFILSQTTFFWSYYYCLWMFPIHGETRFSSNWLPTFKGGCDWLIPNTWFGCEKQIRESRPNKDQRSVSIPHIVRYPPTTHRDIPLRFQKTINTGLMFLFSNGNLNGTWCCVF